LKNTKRFDRNDVIRSWKDARSEIHQIIQSVLYRYGWQAHSKLQNKTYPVDIGIYIFSFYHIFDRIESPVPEQRVEVYLTALHELLAEKGCHIDITYADNQSNELLTFTLQVPTVYPEFKHALSTAVSNRIYPTVPKTLAMTYYQTDSVNAVRNNMLDILRTSHNAWKAMFQNIPHIDDFMKYAIVVENWVYVKNYARSLTDYIYDMLRIAYMSMPPFAALKSTHDRDPEYDMRYRNIRQHSVSVYTNHVKNNKSPYNCTMHHLYSYESPIQYLTSFGKLFHAMWFVPEAVGALSLPRMLTRLIALDESDLHPYHGRRIAYDYLDAVDTIVLSLKDAYVYERENITAESEKAMSILRGFVNYKVLNSVGRLESIDVATMNIDLPDDEKHGVYTSIPATEFHGLALNSQSFKYYKTVYLPKVFVDDYPVQDLRAVLREKTQKQDFAHSNRPQRRLFEDTSVRNIISDSLELHHIVEADANIIPKLETFVQRVVNIFNDKDVNVGIKYNLLKRMNALGNSVPIIKNE